VESFEVGEAGGETRSRRFGPGVVREVVPSGAVERALIVVAGSAQPLTTERESVKVAANGPGRRAPCTLVDNHKGASGLERGTRLLRGENSEGESLSGSGMKQGHEVRAC